MQKSESIKRNFVHSLSFSIRDSFLAVRFGFNARNIWAFWKGIVVIWFILAFSVYAGFYASGDNIVQHFSTARLCPVPNGLFMSSIPAVIILVLGILFSFVIFIRTYMKVSRLTFEQIRGDQFFTEADARRTLKTSWKSAIISPLVIFLGIAVAIFAIYIIGLFSKIPFIGNIALGLFAVPLIVLGLFIVLALIVLLLSLVLAPVITATTKGDSFELLFELFSTVTSQPLRLFNWFFAGTALRIIGVVSFLIFAWGSVSIISSTFEKTAGIYGFSSTIESSLSKVAPEVAPFYSSIFNPVSSTSHSETGLAPVTELFISFTGVALFLVLFSYWLSTGNALWTIIYLGARFHRDREDLLLRADEEEQREFIRTAAAFNNKAT